MAEIQFNVDEALAKAGELVAKHGPQVIDGAAQVVRINAVQSLLTGALAGGLLYGGIRAFSFFAQKAKAAYDEDDLGMPMIGWGVLIGVDVIACGIATAFTLGNIFDVWAWVALFNPKLALAHQLLARFVGG